MSEEMHSPGDVIEAFRELLWKGSRFEAEIRDLAYGSIHAPDSFRFERGVPLSSIENILDIIDDALWIAGAGRLMPVMAESFPGIKGECAIIENELISGRLDPREVLKASFTGYEGENSEIASRLGVSAALIAFILELIAKPLVEKISSHLSLFVKDLFWDKGYCPICGTMPKLALLHGEGVHRQLRCAFCSHEWRFTLLRCPFCESEDHEDFEIFSAAGRESEIADACHKCGRYVPTIDLRQRPVAGEVGAVTLMHLDVIARKKGFLPASVCVWSILRNRDLFSFACGLESVQ